MTLLHAVIDIRHLRSIEERSSGGLQQGHIDSLLQFDYLQDIHILIVHARRPLSFISFSNLTTLRLSLKAYVIPRHPYPDVLLQGQREWQVLAATTCQTPPGLRNLYINLTLTNRYLPWAEEYDDQSAFGQFTFKLEEDFYPQLQSLDWRLLDSNIDVQSRPALQKIYVCIGLVNVWCKDSTSNTVSYGVIEKGLQERIPAWCSDSRRMQDIVTVSLQHN